MQKYTLFAAVVSSNESNNLTAIIVFCNVV